MIQDINNDVNRKKHNGVSVGLIVGAAVGVIIFLGIVGTIVYYSIAR